MALSAEIKLDTCFESEVFEVVRADIDSFGFLQKMIEVWKQTVDLKQKEVKSKKERIQFDSCRSILQIVDIGLNPKCAEHDQTYFCVSSMKVLQGIMQLRIGQERDLIVHTLVANPGNICSALNPNQVRGQEPVCLERQRKLQRG